jgi:hypothetical protein
MQWKAAQSKTTAEHDVMLFSAASHLIAAQQQPSSYKPKLLSAAGSCSAYLQQHAVVDLLPAEVLLGGLSKPCLGVLQALKQAILGQRIRSEANNPVAFHNVSDNCHCSWSPPAGS